MKHKSILHAENGWQQEKWNSTKKLAFKFHERYYFCVHKVVWRRILHEHLKLHQATKYRFCCVGQWLGSFQCRISTGTHFIALSSEDIAIHMSTVYESVSSLPLAPTVNMFVSLFQEYVFIFVRNDDTWQPIR